MFQQFFGKQTSTSGSSIDTIDSIENIIRSQGSKIGEKELDTLRNALQARFVTGERSGAGLMEGLRQLGYISTLPNPLSVMTQIGDMALELAGFSQGFLCLLRNGQRPVDWFRFPFVRIFR